MKIMIGFLIGNSIEKDWRVNVLEYGTMNIFLESNNLDPVP